MVGSAPRARRGGGADRSSARHQRRIVPAQPPSDGGARLRAPRVRGRRRRCPAAPPQRGSRMTQAPSDADARFDRTADRWFRDQLALRPEVATFLGLHDRDAELSPGGRDAIDDEVAFYRRTIDELSAIDPGELTADRAL